MNILAWLSEDTLERIYELTYKYGWINHDEDVLGWLPDRAYNEKYLIEGELASYLAEGFEELIHTYNYWLSHHTREGWIETVKGEFEPEYMFRYMGNWGINFTPVLLDIVSRELNIPEDEVEVWQMEETATTFDRFLAKYRQIVADNMDEILDKCYDLYLDVFTEPRPGGGGKSLREEIQDVEAAYSVILDSQNAPLDERAAAFQLGLTTAHHSGVMADHLLGSTMGYGRKVLDRLTKGPQVEEWDQELERILGHPKGTLRKEVPVEMYDPELIRRRRERWGRLNAFLNLATTLGIMLVGDKNAD